MNRSERVVFWAGLGLLAARSRIYHVRGLSGPDHLTACGVETKHLMQTVEWKLRARGVDFCSRCRKVLRDDELRAQYDSATKAGARRAAGGSDLEVNRPFPRLAAVLLLSAFWAACGIAVLGAEVDEKAPRIPSAGAALPLTSSAPSTAILPRIPGTAR